MIEKFLIPSLCLALVLVFSPSVGFSEETETEEAISMPEKEDITKKSLEEILKDEKKQRYAKIDDFLTDFDKGFDQNMGEKFEDLLEEDQFLDDDDDISTEDFETFNQEFDKMIEEDLAHFELFEIDADTLGEGLVLDKDFEGPPEPTKEN